MPLSFQTFIAPARRRPQLWRLVLGLAAAGAIYAAWVVMTVGLAWWASATGFDPIWLERMSRADRPGALLVILVTFLGMMIGPIVAVRLLHDRPGRTLFGPAPRVLHDFAVAVAVMAAISAVSLAAWFLLFDGLPNLGWSRWLLYLPFALAGVLVQTGAEEVLFRGYLLQQLAARFRSPAIWMGVPALVFGAVHYDPATAGGNAWLVVLSAGLFGLLAADLVVRTGSLGAAWGFHFANNVVALLVIGTSGTLTGLARWTTPYGADDAALLGWLMPVDLVVMLAAWWALRRLLAR